MKTLRAKIRRSHPQHGAGSLSAVFFPRVGFRWLGGLGGPGGEEFGVEGGYGQIIAQEVAVRGKGFIVPGIVGEGLAAVGGAGQRDGSAIVVAPAVVKDKVHGAALRIDRHPLEELVVAVVNRVVVHAHRSAPGMAMISGGGDKHVHVSVDVVAPGDVEVAAFFAAAGVHSNLREPVGAGDADDAEIGWSCGDDVAVFAEALPAIVGNGHHDSVAVVPDGVKSSVRPHHALKTFQPALVVARPATGAAGASGVGTALS